MFWSRHIRLGACTVLHHIGCRSGLLHRGISSTYLRQCCDQLSSTNLSLSMTSNSPRLLTACTPQKVRFCHNQLADDDDWARDLGTDPVSARPVTVVLRHSKRTVQVYRVNERDLAAINDVISLANDAVSRRDNVGVDEFPLADDLQQALCNGSRTALFTVHDTTGQSSALLAAILVQPCQAARSIRPRLASVQVIASDQVSRNLAVARDLRRLAVHMVLAVGEGFVACVTSVYYECFRHLPAWFDEGFVVTACIPLAGLLHPSTVSETAVRDSSCDVSGQGSRECSASSSYLLYRKLDGWSARRDTVNDIDTAPFRAYDDVTSYADSLCSKSSRSSGQNVEDEESLWLSRSPPQLEYLPVVCTLPKSGFKVKVRTVDKSEIGRYYETFMEAANNDHGFRRDEIPTRRIFAWLYSQYWNIVIEDANNGDWLAVLSVSPSPFTRTRRRSYLCDGAIVVTPGYRKLRRGLPRDLLQLWCSLTVDLGFHACLYDTAMDNIEAVRVSVDTGLIAVGSLPSAMSRDHGKSPDVVLLYRSLADVKSFKDSIRAPLV